MKKKTILTAIATVLAVVILIAVFKRPTAHSPVGQDGGRSPHASLLSMTQGDGYWRVDIRDPWKQDRTLHTYVLVSRKDSARVRDLPDGTLIYTPVERSVVFTAAHCQLLCWLGAGQAITGVCDMKYINIPWVRAHAEDCGDGMLPMVENIVDLRPQVLLISPFENSGGYGRLEQTGIPIVETADYMETSPLGRAAWMRFYGLLYGRSHEADSLFQTVDSTYRQLCGEAAAMPKGRSVLTERITGSTWYVPGGRSTMGVMLADAHAGYAWAADEHSGSLPLSFEEVLDKAGQSDLWLVKYNGPEPLTRDMLQAEYHGYSQLKALNGGEVYACNTTRKPYFEEVSFRPDLLLREIISLTHPGWMPADSLRYYERIE